MTESIENTFLDNPSNSNGEFECKTLLQNKNIAKIGPLNSRWSFWYSKKTQGSSASAEGFSNSLRIISTFNSVPGFYRCYSYLKRPSDLPPNNNYYLFRDQIHPAWESFQDGGCWTLRFKKRSPYLSLFWETLLFACIGEQFDESKVVGIVVSTRAKVDSVSVWTNDSSVKDSVKESIKKILKIDPAVSLEYKEYPIHENQQSKPI